MKAPGKGTSAYVIAFVIFLVVFAYLLLTTTQRVVGGSMTPTLLEGDLVLLQSVSISDVKYNDIVVYGSPCSANGESVIHRVVGGNSVNGFITKGDNNGYTDQASGIAVSPITQSCLHGKVVYVVPYIERLASLPYGTNYLLALLIVFAVLYSEFRNKGGDKGLPALEPVT